MTLVKEITFFILPKVQQVLEFEALP